MANYTEGTERESFIHGHNQRGKRSKTYNSWTALRARCENPNNARYKDYGGRGITVDPRWRSFAAFLADMGTRPKGTTLDRKDNNGPYCKDNCVWSTPKEQGNNKRQYSSNKTGITGVHATTRHKRFSYWGAQGRNATGAIISLYNGPDFFEACCARKSYDAKIKGLNGGYNV